MTGPERPGAAEHDHDQQGEREARGRDARRGAADQEQVDHAARGGEERREHEDRQLEPERPQAEHLDAQLVLADRLPDAPGEDETAQAETAKTTAA